jgi:hypothetical protein
MESANAVKAKEAAAAAPTTLAANTTGGVTNLVPATNVADTTGITALQPQATSPQPSVSPPPAQTSTADAQAAVNNIYRNVLGRDADATGLNFWSNAIANGRSVDSVYQDILASANMVKSAGTLGDFGIKTMTAADATKPYTGFTSTESNTIADEWVRNTLGREPTAADRAQSWYKDVANLGTNTDAAKVYGQFQGYAGTEATKTIADRIKAIDAELKAKNLTDADLLAQTGKTKQQLAAEGFKTGLDFMGASQLAPAASRTKFDLAALKKTLTPQTNAPAGTTTPYGNATNPGDITINPDGSKTITPNIPGRPYGGFRGIQEIKDAYTQGGGSLGYTSPVVQTAEEHEARYNKLTGDSEAAYRYLMGKGANPIKSTAPKIAVPYDEYALGKKTAGLKPATVSGNTLTVGGVSYDLTDPTKPPPADTKGPWQWNVLNKRWIKVAADGTVISDGSGSGGVGGNSGGPSGGSDGAIGTGGMGADGGDGAQSGGGADNARGGLMPHGAYHMAAGGITGNGQLNLNIPLDIGGGGGGGGGGYTPMGGGFSSGGGYQGQGNQNSVQQSGMPDFRDQMAGFDAQIQKLPSVTAYSNYTNSISGRPPTADERAQIDQLRKAVTSDQGFMDLQSQMKNTSNKYQQAAMQSQSSGLQQRYAQQSPNVKTSANSFNDRKSMGFANGGMMGYAVGGGLGSLGSYSDGGRLLKGPGDGVSDSIPATIGAKQQPARLADGEFVIPARIVSELGNGSTDAGAKKLYAMMDRVQRARGKTTGKNKVAANSRSDKYLPA